MNTQETILQLEKLKLKGMATCYKSLESMPKNQWPNLDTFVARLAEAEQEYRNRKRTELYLKTSKLRYNAVIEDVVCSEERNLSKETLLKLMDCSFIDRTENLLIDGKTGCGKSFPGLKYMEDNPEKTALIIVPSTHIKEQWKKN